MAYCTLTDLIARFGEQRLLELTDFDHADQIGVDRVTLAIRDADALIESYVALRYAVPVTPAPPVLVGVACDLVLATLSGDNASEAVRTARRDAVALLSAIATDRASLPGAVAAPAGQTLGLGSPVVATPARRLDRCSLRDYLS